MATRSRPDKTGERTLVVTGEVENNGGGDLSTYPRVSEDEVHQTWPEDEGKDTLVRDSLNQVKAQLVELQLHIQSVGKMASIVETSQSDMDENGKREKEPLLEEDFLAIGRQDAADSAQQSVGNTALLTSWRDKVSCSNISIGMLLKFFPPLLENGKQVVHIDSHDLEDSVNV